MTYNNKHGFHAYVYFICVTPHGHIAYLSRIRSGTEHDKSFWNSCDAVEKMNEAYPVIPDDWSFVVAGDKAYRGNV